MLELRPVLALLPLLLAAAPPTAAECGACHTEAFETWSRSRHAASATNATYRASHAREPMQWCDGCHAPFGVEEGISCASCHVREGVVLTGHTPSLEGQRAHPMREDATLNHSELCASCHQFNFPTSRDEPVRFSAHPMQNTLAEWRASGGTQSCQTCHPAHDPRGPHDVSALRASIRGTATQAAGEVRIVLEPIGVPHRFPTGDPFRRLALSLCRDEACTSVVATRELERQVRATHDGWEISDDLTVPREGLQLAIPCTGARFVRLTYRYAARSSENVLDDDERETALFTQPILRSPP